MKKDDQVILGEAHEIAQPRVTNLTLPSETLLGMSPCRVQEMYPELFHESSPMREQETDESISLRYLLANPQIKLRILLEFGFPLPFIISHI